MRLIRAVFLEIDIGQSELAFAPAEAAPPGELSPPRITTLEPLCQAKEIRP